jgi:hypothetical protein
MPRLAKGRFSSLHAEIYPLVWKTDTKGTPVRPAALGTIQKKVFVLQIQSFFPLFPEDQFLASTCRSRLPAVKSLPTLHETAKNRLKTA